jgi:urocanate hydratase
MQRDLQHETMRIYKNVIDFGEEWGGRLVLCCGPGCAQSGAPTAVSIARGTTLAIDSDATAMKSAMRTGYLDFVVNTLDEGLRTLKNEIRQKRPLSVGLISSVEATLVEMVERGLQPDLYLIHLSTDMNKLMTAPNVRILCARGMLQRILSDVVDNQERPYRPMLMVNRKRHYEYFFPAPNAATLREIDAVLLAALPAEDFVRRRWLEDIPKYLREARSEGRWTWLSDEELESLATQGLIPG